MADIQPNFLDRMYEKQVYSSSRGSCLGMNLKMGFLVCHGLFLIYAGVLMVMMIMAASTPWMSANPVHYHLAMSFCSWLAWIFSILLVLAAVGVLLVSDPGSLRTPGKIWMLTCAMASLSWLIYGIYFTASVKQAKDDIVQLMTGAATGGGTSTSSKVGKSIGGAIADAVILELCSQAPYPVSFFMYCSVRQFVPIFMFIVGPQTFLIAAYLSGVPFIGVKEYGGNGTELSSAADMAWYYTAEGRQWLQEQGYVEGQFPDLSNGEKPYAQNPSYQMWEAENYGAAW